MLVKFISKSCISVSMFEKDAKSMLALMGHSGTIPSAIRANDVAARLATMQQALRELQQQQDAEDEGEDPAEVSVDRRAFPLMEMMKQAVQAEEDVMWDYERPLF